METRIRRRAYWLLAWATLAWLALGARLWLWQVVRGPGLAATAVANRTLKLPLAPRGRILDRSGQELGDPQPGWAVAVFPALLADRAAAAAALAPVLGTPAAALAGRLAQAPPREPFWLADGLSRDQAAQAAALGLRGVAVAAQPERYGPGALARHVLGYVNNQGGQLGLEAQYNDVLAGSAGPHLVAFLDARHRPLAGLGVRRAQVLAGKPPHDLHLTLDRRVQAAVEAALDATAAPGAGAPLRAAVVVLDPATGDLLALASRPQFDPRVGPPPEGGEWAPLVNRAVAPYPPGSVFKPLVAAAALDAGALTPEYRYYCPGHFDLGGMRFHDATPGGHGWVTPRTALAKSCNVFFVHVGYELLGRERLLAAAARFGLGRPAGAGLWGEAGGLLPAAGYGGEVAQLAFGQGLTVTALQLARAYGALATDGRLPALGLVSRVTGPGGEVLVRPGRAPRERAVGAAAARAVAEMLGAVTDPAGGGTGRAAWVPGAGSAGKTGSAQAGSDHVHAWFVGWAPRERPRYVLAVLVEDGGAGGVAAAPLFRAIAGRLLAAPQPVTAAPSRP